MQRFRKSAQAVGVPIDGQPELLSNQGSMMKTSELTSYGTKGGSKDNWRERHKKRGVKVTRTKAPQNHYYTLSLGPV